MILILLSLVLSVQAATQLDKLAAHDAAVDDFFGASVAVSGNMVVVGAYGDDDAGSESGSAYVYDCSSMPCIETSKLTASDAAPGNIFGHAVAVSGTTVVVGAPWDDDAGIKSGSAYVYDCSSTPCIETGKLTASDAAPYDYLGTSVAMDGNKVVAGAWGQGAFGAAYVFDLSICGASCTEVNKLSASDGAPNDYLGTSVALDANIVAVSATGVNLSTGAAYVFDTNICGTSCTEASKLTASDAGVDDFFGSSVAVEGNTVVVGAWGHDNGGNNTGAAYVFDASTCGASCTEASKLTASDADADDELGYAVAMDGNTVVVGAAFDDQYSGSVYVFDRSTCGASCTEVSKLTASDATAVDQFGYAVAIDGLAIVAGAPYESGHGAAYVFDMRDTEIDVQRPAGTSIADGGTDAIGNQTVGTITQIYTIANTGLAPLVITAERVSNLVNVSNFAVVTGLPLSITSGGAAALEIQFDVDAPGAFSFDLSIVNNDPDENPYTITVSGIGSQSEIDVQRPAGTSIADGGMDAIGDRAVGTHALTYTIASMARAPLTVSAASGSNLVNASNAVAVTGLPLTVAAGASEPLEIQFDVDALGAFSFDLSIANNDPDENPYTITISGTGTSAGTDHDPTVSTSDGPVWQIILEANPPFAQPGDPVVFTATIRKLSGGTPVSMTFPISDAFLIQSVTQNRGVASYTGQTVSFTDEMHMGDEAIITVDTVLSPEMRPPYILVEEACLTNPVSMCYTTQVVSVRELPSTGETPLWHNWVLAVGAVAVFGLLSIGFIVLRGRRGHEV